MTGIDRAALRAEARVDLNAIKANVEALHAHATGADVMAVVKADGYGHGLVESARAAIAGGAAWLGVATIDEALTIRSAGLDIRTLAWLNAPDEPWTAAIAADIDLSANAVWAVQQIADAAKQAGLPARVHLKVDSGLGRAGAPPPHDWPDLVDVALKAEADGHVRVVGLWSHFAYADAPGHPTIARQIAVFNEAVELAERHGVRPEVRHLANSAATLTLPEAHFDVVRPGIAVYGLTPIPQEGPPSIHGLTPAMTLSARVILTKRVPAGHGVSYGHEYTTDRETTLALVPLGYADGVPRAATNRGLALLGGRQRTIAGRVCMDQFVLDVGDDQVAAGDEVVLFGSGGHGEPTAEEWAQMLGTISYEIVTRIGPRVPRVYQGTITT